MARVTEYRCDPDLTEILVKESLPTAAVDAKASGVRFTAAWGRQAFKIGGKFKFWGGLTLEAVGGGPGLVESLTADRQEAGIEIWYGARAVSLVADDDGVHGVRRQAPGKTDELKARRRARRGRLPGEHRMAHALHGAGLGARQGARHALQHRRRDPHGARCRRRAHGNWSGCHAVAWDRNAPETGDLAVGDGFQKHSYPWGVYINAEGKRFVDEGADFRNYTYAKYGRVILSSPSSSPGRSSTPK